MAWVIRSRTTRVTTGWVENRSSQWNEAPDVPPPPPKNPSPLNPLPPSAQAPEPSSSNIKSWAHKPDGGCSGMFG